MPKVIVNLTDGVYKEVKGYPTYTRVHELAPKLHTAVLEGKDVECITPDEFTVKMKELKDKYGTDREALHSEMDNLMCEILKAHGYTEGVELFENADIWYT